MTDGVLRWSTIFMPDCFQLCFFYSRIVWCVSIKRWKILYMYNWFRWGVRPRVTHHTIEKIGAFRCWIRISVLHRCNVQKNRITNNSERQSLYVWTVVRNKTRSPIIPISFPVLHKRGIRFLSCIIHEQYKRTARQASYSHPCRWCKYFVVISENNDWKC